MRALFRICGIFRALNRPQLFVNLLTRHFTIAAIGLAAAALTGCNYGLMGASASMAGPQLYRSCVNCHGPAGAGRADVGAPRIAGLPQWYLASQLHRFQDGLRGKHPDDYDGLRMRAMSQQMRSAAEIDAIAAYVSSLPAETNPASPKGGS